ncbi:MAG: hypothetical protein ACT4P7_16815 [Gemmatimonadaceae bacterium]
MSTALIGPDNLEVDAIVPQCLDNQYVSDSVFGMMIAGGLDYDDPKIAELRERDFRTEFMRSLVYSSQVIIQRAFLHNSDFLYKHYLPEDRANLGAFARLTRERAIVPFLFREASLRDSLDFDLSQAGGRAARALLDEVGDDVSCVRLAVDDIGNERAAASMAAKFGMRLSGIQHLNDTQRNAMASELFADASRLQEAGAWDAFNQAINRLAYYSFTKPEQLRRGNKNAFLTRSDVYRDNFVREGTEEQTRNNVVTGRFKPPGPDAPFLLELKKFVDLVYNVNLPDHLKRYTFTAANMPTRMALQDEPGEGYSADQVSAVVSDDDALESIRRAFMARTQQPMSLPLLSDLTIADVVAVRTLPAWQSFKDAQAQILKDPLHCLDLFDKFQAEFDSFQRALSAWYNDKYGRRKTEERYTSYISLALSLAGKLIVAGSNLSGPAKALAGFASEQVVKSIPKTVKGYAAKLMVGVYDVGRQRLDSDRTYTIELMQTNAELTRADVMELLNSIHRKAGSDMPHAEGQVADQGIA